MSQLALPVRLDDHAVFATFHRAGNEAAVDALQRIADGAQEGLWLSGLAASGKTHLLQALCERTGDDAVYLSAELLAAAGPAMLEGLESRRVIAIDDVDHLLGDRDVETALFSLYNLAMDQGSSLVLSASAARRELDVLLPDLESRFAQLPSFHLAPLNEDDHLAALRLRATHRGLELPNETAQYLMNRARRDMHSLYAVLDKLDKEALRAQRRLTIPFVRSVLASED
ncbi:MAG: DnaA regulatory inactivator Hda [Pseudomonadota bacterium]